jgi:hypothetical protein
MVPYIIRECVALILRVSKVQSFLDLLTVENEDVSLKHANHSPNSATSHPRRPESSIYTIVKT